MTVTRSTLIISDLVLAATVGVMNFSIGGFSETPVFLKLLVIITFAVCIVRHINYYKLTKRIY